MVYTTQMAASASTSDLWFARRWREFAVSNVTHTLAPLDEGGKGACPMVHPRQRHSTMDQQAVNMQSKDQDCSPRWVTDF